MEYSKESPIMNNYIVVSESCESSAMLFGKVLQELQNEGFCMIALDEPLTPCITELLGALQVTSLPAVCEEGVLHCGKECLEWARGRGFDVSDCAEGTTLNDLRIAVAKKRYVVPHSKNK